MQPIGPNMPGIDQRAKAGSCAFRSIRCGLIRRSFPEGTRQPPGAAPDYKPGVAAIYRELDLPCTPVALNTGLFCHGLLRKPGQAVIRFLPPIPASLPRREFMRQLEERIEAGCAELAREVGA